MLAVLALDGVLSALMAVFFLPLRIGAVPVPISATAQRCRQRRAGVGGAAVDVLAPARGLPIWTWLLTVVIFTFGGPGDDIVFGGVGLMEYAVVVLIALGALPAAWVLTRR